MNLQILNLLSNTLKGGALLYVVLLSLIISSLLGAYLIVNFYQQVLINRYYFSELAADNLESGMVQYLAEGFPVQRADKFGLYDSSIDSCQIQRESWGMWGLVHGTGIHGKERTSRSCLVGRHLPASLRFSLYLSDQRQPLVVIGKTRLEGQLFLPGAGLKTGYINRRPYEGDRLHYGNRKDSQRDSDNFQTQPQLMSGIWAVLNQVEAGPGSEEMHALSGTEIDQPWTEEAYEIRTAGTLELREVSLRGKCRVIAGEALRIGPETQLTHSLLFARRIHISAGFHGTIQAFATESIEVEAGVVLSYPSILLLSRGTESGTLQIGDGAQVAGAVIMERQRKKVTRDIRDYVYIGKGSLIQGQVLVPDNLDLQATVFGTVITDRFVLKSPGSNYRNHLIDAHISFDSLAQAYAAPLFLEGGPYKIVEWL